MDFSRKKKPADAAAYEQAVRSDLQAEVVENVPVKQPIATNDSGDNPLANPIHGTPDHPAGRDSEIDKILEDVNQKVKSAAADVKPKKNWLAFFKKKPAAPKSPPTAEKAPAAKPRRSLPLLITAVAILAGLALSVAAYFAFSQESEQPTTTSTTRDPESANTSVAPEDIDNLSADLQSQIGDLNSGQDFDSAALSDSSLGL
jgi:hypothetical protein